MKSFFSALFVILLGFIFLALDAVLHVHVFFVGFLLTAALFFSRERLIYMYIIAGVVQDVRFQFPLGTTYIFIALFLVLFPFLLRLIRSRMIALETYLVFCSIVLLLIDQHFHLEPNDILKTIILSAVVVAGVYLLSLRFIRQQSVHINTSLLKFS